MIHKQEEKIPVIELGKEEKRSGLYCDSQK